MSSNYEPNLVLERIFKIGILVLKLIDQQPYDHRVIHDTTDLHENLYRFLSLFSTFYVFLNILEQYKFSDYFRNFNTS
jgi:hypothetical protein